MSTVATTSNERQLSKSEVKLNTKLVILHRPDIVPFASGNDEVPEDVQVDCARHQKALAVTEAQAKQYVAELELKLQKSRLYLQGIQDAQAVYRSLLAPIRRLPAEIIAKFFAFVLECPRQLRKKDLDQLSSLQLVCRKWRDVANSTPILWRGLDIACTASSNFVTGLRSWFDRAGTDHLELTLHQCATSPTLQRVPLPKLWDDPLHAPDRAFLDTLINFKSWTKLSLQSCADSFLPTLLSYLISSSPTQPIDLWPNLEYLAVGRNSIHHEREGGLAGIPIYFLFVYARSMKQVSIRGFSIFSNSTESFPLPLLNLTHLHLSDMVLDPTTLAVFLTRAPTLTDITLERIARSFDYAETTQVATSVRRITIVDCFYLIPSQWVWPALEWVRIQLDPLSNAIRYRTIRFGRLKNLITHEFTCPALKGLSLESCDLPGQHDFAQLVARFPAPRVEHLRVWSCNFVQHLKNSSWAFLTRYRHIIADMPLVHNIGVLDKLLAMAQRKPRSQGTGKPFEVTFWGAKKWVFPRESEQHLADLAELGIVFAVGCCPTDEVEFWIPGNEA